MSAGVRALSLDVAGTLIRPAAPIEETYARTALAIGIDPRAADLRSRFGAAMARMPPMAFPGLDGAALVSAERGWWRQLVGGVFAHAPGRLVDECFERLYTSYADAAAWRLVERAAETLDRLRAARLQLAVVSNFDSRLLGVLAGLGIADRFETIVYSTAAGAAKPEGAIFEAALRRLGRVPAEVLHVGDRVETDYHGARAAGLQALLVAARPVAGCARIAALAELPGWLGLD